MSKSALQDLLHKALQHAELLIYAIPIALAFIQARNIHSFALVALLGGAALFIIRQKAPYAATFLLLYPLLCYARDSLNLYFAITSSIIASLSLHGPLKSAFKLRPSFSALSILFLSLLALAHDQPIVKSSLGAVNVRIPSVDSHISLIFNLLFKVTLQWLSMHYMLYGTVASFDNTESVLISQLLGSFIPYSLEKSLHLSGSNGMAVLHFGVAICWISFWIYESTIRLTHSKGLLITLSSAFAVIVASIFAPFIPLLYPKVMSFLLIELDLRILGLWIASFASFSLIIAALKNKLSNTVIRKGFHFMALAMFLPAMIISSKFLRTCLCLATLVFLLIEFIRYSHVLGQVASDFLTQLMNAVTNERDRKGPLTTSHIYLLLGCGFALIFVNEDEAQKLPLDVMAGPLLVLTVGDSFASIIGSKFGKHRWISTNRTIEGTLAGILTTLGSLYALATFFHLSLNWTVVSASMVLTFALEAYTQAIDNLVLPIFYFAALRVLSCKFE